jgi:hypothetical protein
VGFAIRKGIAFDGHANVTALMLCNPQRRSSDDMTIRPSGHAPIRLPSVHLKLGCFFGNAASACPTLLQQVAPLEEWIDAAAISKERFPVLGDWNRRLALPGDSVWLEIDDGTPANADLRLADQGTPPGCDPRYGSSVDHIVFDKRAGADLLDSPRPAIAPGEALFRSLPGERVSGPLTSGSSGLIAIDGHCAVRLPELNGCFWTVSGTAAFRRGRSDSCHSPAPESDDRYRPKVSRSASNRRCPKADVSWAVPSEVADNAIDARLS